MTEQQYWKEADKNLKDTLRYYRIAEQRLAGKPIVYDESEPAFTFAVLREGDTARLVVF